MDVMELTALHVAGVEVGHDPKLFALEVKTIVLVPLSDMVAA